MAKKLSREEQVERLRKVIEKKQLTAKELSEIVDQVKHPKLRVKEVDLSKHLKDGSIKFGVVSDTQLNSKYARINDILPTLYQHFKKERADFVVHCGDISNGCLYKNKAVDIDEMIYVGDHDIIHHVISEYPKAKGLKTYFIGGNDDYTFIKKRRKGLKIDMGPIIAAQRPDMVFLGMTEADIKLAPKTTLKLLHPLPGLGGKKPYGTSYPLQKLIDNMEGGEKPDILCVGYYHRAYHFNWRDVHAFLAGTTQNQTPSMRAQQLGADIGAWMLEAHVDKKGSLKEVEAEFIPFYK